MRFIFLFFGLAFSFVLSGCGPSKLETENAELNSQIAKLEAENAEIKQEVSKSEAEDNQLKSEIEKEKIEIESLRQQTNNDSQLKVELKSEIDSSKQQISKLQDELVAEANDKKDEQKTLSISIGIKKIEAHLQKLLDEHYDSANNDDEQERLNRLANSEKEQVEEIVIDLDGQGFIQDSSLKMLIDDFLFHYNLKIEAEHTANAFIRIDGDLSDKGYVEQIAEFTKQDAEAKSDLSKISDFEVVK
jgi:outer membrane murein-binding lipoprotein Lpp